MLPPSETTPQLPLDWRTQLAASTLARVIMNIAIRMIYPFMPEFSRALQVPQETLVFVTSSRYTFSIAAPLFASLPDRFGPRNVMLFAMAMFVSAVLLVVLMPGFPTFVTALFMASTAKNIYDPAAYSYWSEHSDYSRRGLVLAIYETSWSVSFLAGMPLVGWLMARNAVSAWQYPFIMMAVCGALATILLLRVLQKQAPGARHEHALHRSTRPWRTVLTDTRVLCGLAVGFLVSMANENILVVLGSWLEVSFGLSLTALGLVSLVIGVAELSGEGGVMAFVDRMGKRRAALLGLFLSSLAFAAVHLLAVNVVGAFLGLFLLFLTFEFTIVATLPLMSELVPTARAQTMSVNMTMLLLGRMLGALLGGLLFKSGFLWNVSLGVILNLLAMAVLYWGVKEEVA